MDLFAISYLDNLLLWRSLIKVVAAVLPLGWMTITVIKGMYVKRAIHHVKRFDLKYWKTSDILCIFRDKQTNNCERILLQIIFLYDCSPRYLDTQRRNTRIRRPSNFFHFQYFESRSKHMSKPAVHKDMEWSY